MYSAQCSNVNAEIDLSTKASKTADNHDLPGKKKHTTSEDDLNENNLGSMPISRHTFKKMLQEDTARQTQREAFDSKDIVITPSIYFTC